MGSVTYATTPPIQAAQVAREDRRVHARTSVHARGRACTIACSRTHTRTHRRPYSCPLPFFCARSRARTSCRGLDCPLHGSTIRRMLMPFGIAPRAGQARLRRSGTRRTRAPCVHQPRRPQVLRTAVGGTKRYCKGTLENPSRAHAGVCTHRSVRKGGSPDGFDCLAAC
jgi:hypothetical protein